jgi:tellurite resistance protein TerC
MSAGLNSWILFNVAVLAMLALDLGVFHRKAHAIGMREALAWSGVWISLALVFNAGILFGWVGAYAPAARETAAFEFLTGYLIEKSLSIDNVFFFALLFTYFRIPAEYQHRVLFWGIIGALIMRAILIFAGIALLDRFHWLVYVFGAVLIASGVKMWMAHGQSFDPETNPALRLIRRVLPVTNELHGQRFFVRHAGKLLATPLFVVLLFVEWTDLIFAVDSIPAILAITQDPFIVYTSNVMAILGLRSLYFALAEIMARFHLLHYGLSAILVFIGVKMLLVDFYKVPTPISLAVVATILAVSVALSLWQSAPKRGAVAPPANKPVP